MKTIQNGNPLVLLLIDDLIFVSKVSIAAREAGVDTRVITRTDFDDIEKLVGPADLILVDLNAEQLNPVEFIRTVSELPTVRDTRIVCYVAHIDKELIEEAERYEGVTVLPRSQFVEQLPGILEGVKQE